MVKRIQPLDMVRGDTLPLALTVTDRNGGLYTATSAEKILFGLKRDKKDDACIFTRQAVGTGEKGQYTITLYPEDTENLEPGVYSYDVGLYSGETSFHIIWPSDFTIEANVTGRGNAG
jgi:hypothetical protein